MIWQTFHEPGSDAKAFDGNAYRPFDLRSLGLDPWEQTQLSEYAALRYFYQFPGVDTDDWIGCTSINQHYNIRLTRKEIEQYLSRGVQVLVWGWMAFVDGRQKPLSMATFADRVHPEINAILFELVRSAGHRSFPDFYNHVQGPMHNYWLMPKPLFREYMEWSLPMVGQCLQWGRAGGGFFDRWPRATSYIHERLFPIWLGYQSGLTVAILNGTPEAPVEANNADVSREIEKQRMVQRGKVWRD